MPRIPGAIREVFRTDVEACEKANGGNARRKRRKTSDFGGDVSRGTNEIHRNGRVSRETT